MGDPMPVEWSTCQLSENASCGQGVRTRLLSCVRSDGKPVSMDQCEQVMCLCWDLAFMAFSQYWSIAFMVYDVDHRV